MIRVVGFGNDLHGDDGFGPAVIAALDSAPLPPGTEARLGGVPGLGAVALFEGCETVVVVDALDDGGPAGELGWADPDRMEAAETSPLHGGDLAGLLRLLPLALDGPIPRIELLLCRIGEARGYRRELSPEVAGAVTTAAAMIRERLAGHG